MCQLSNLSPVELDKFTKAQLIALALADRPPTPDPSMDILDAKGQLLKREMVYRDVAGKATYTETIENVYYPTGEIDTILIYQRDSTGTGIGKAKRVKHFRGVRYRPPELTLIAMPVIGPPK